MKLFKKLTGLLVGTAMALGLGVGLMPQKIIPVHADGTTVSWIASDQGYSNGETVSSAVIDTNITITFTDGGTATAYYDTGTAVRIYNGGTFTIAAASGTMSSIVLEYELNSGATISCNNAGWAEGTKTWTGAENSVTWTAGTKKHVRLSSVTVTYGSSGPVHSHTPGTPVEENRIEPTCTTAGGYDIVTYCTECEVELSRVHTDLAALGHNYVDGECTRCHEAEPTLDYLEVLPNNGTAIDGGTVGVEYSISKHCITIDATGTLTSDQARVFKNKTMTISGVTMKKIVITCTANGTTKQGPGCWGTGAPEGYTFETNGKTGTWEGLSNSVSFTAVDNQVRITQFQIYIAAEGFAELFLSKLTCNSAGTSAPTYTTGYSWTEFENIYKTLDVTEKGRFTTPDSATVDAVARYDYIVGKYGYTDFMHRNPAQIGHANFIALGFNQNTAVNSVAIIIVATVTILSLGVFFILRKKKEN